MKKDQIADHASMGGLARARKLSPQERREIARHAAIAGWAEKGLQPPIYAEYGAPDRPLRIGPIEIPCYVLADSRRVLAQRGLQVGVGFSRSGGKLGARRMAQFLESLQSKGVDTKDLAARVNDPIRFIPPHGGNPADGYEATILPDICEVILKADQAGKLLDRQKAFIAKELRKWVKTFPPEFYKEMFRLRRWPFPPLAKNQHRRPVLVGKLTNNIVYDRLAPGVRAELHRLTPRDESGRLKHKLFQRLTEDVGHPKLREHLASLIVLMRASDEWKQFTRMLDRALPRYGEAQWLPFEN